MTDHLGSSAVPVTATSNEAMLAFQQRLAALTPRPWLAQLLVAVNIAVFVLIVVRGVSPMSPTSQALIDWGANHGPRTLGGEGYRLITAMFLHVGLVHLLFNMAVLWDSGRLLERILGTLDFALVYFIAGVGGSLASVVWRPENVSAGASGALFGMYGALFGFLLRNKKSLPEPVVARLKKGATVFIGYNLVFGMMIPNIDMAAHLGGLAAGFACGAFLERPLTVEGRRRTAGRMALAAVLVALAVFAALRTLPKPFDLQRALTEFSAVEADVIAKVNAAAKRDEAGELSNTQLSELLEKEVLAPWKQGGEKLYASTTDAKLTEAQRAEVAKILTYVGLRTAHWELYAEAIRTQDQATLDKALAKQKEADDAARALSKK